MRIILVTLAAWTIGSAFLHAEPARCQQGCNGNIICLSSAGCPDGCWCTVPTPEIGKSGRCIGPGR